MLWNLKFFHDWSGKTMPYWLTLKISPCISTTVMGFLEFDGTVTCREQLHLCCNCGLLSTASIFLALLIKDHKDSYQYQAVDELLLWKRLSYSASFPMEHQISTILVTILSGQNLATNIKPRCIITLLHSLWTHSCLFTCSLSICGYNFLAS